MFDVILKNGIIYDGSGQAGYSGDIGISAGRIAATGNLAELGAKEVVDVSGLAVAPGFIDLHTHSDFTLMVNGKAESQVHQGVTTEVVGQCGFSCAPINHTHDVERMAIGYSNDCKVHVGWHDFAGYLDQLESSPLGVNVAAFVGHGTIHRAVMGDALRAPELDEINAMARRLDEALEQGAYGFSTGLEYWPGSISSPEHIVPLCEVAAKHERLYATHVRNRDIFYDTGFGEALSTARNAGAKLQISHIQPKFGAPDYAMEHTLEMIETAYGHGVDVAFDVIPHDWNHTRIMAILPQWAQEGGVPKILERLKDPTMRERMKDNPKPMWRIVPAGLWNEIALLNSEVNADLVGATFAEIAKIRGVEPFDAVLDLLHEEGERMSQLLWTSHSFQDADIDLCLEQSACAVISDTLALAPYGPLKDHIGSISGYGWAARFLQYYVRDRKILKLEEAIRRVTLLPAQRLGLRDRGMLKPGQCADISVFDAEQIASHCDIKNPRNYASGVAHVLVNGEFAMRDNNRTERDNGQVLRP